MNFKRISVLFFLIAIFFQGFGQSIGVVNPSTAYAGETLTVAISGQSTTFSQGTTNVWFQQGTTTIIYPTTTATVVATDSIRANFAFSKTTPTGYYDVYVHESTTLVKTNGFFLNSFISISPSCGFQGDVLTVSVSGQGTHFGQGTSTTNVWFKQGTSVLYSDINSTNEIKTDSLTTNFTLNTPPGIYDLYIYNSADNTILGSAAFTVFKAISIFPSPVCEGQNVTLSSGNADTYSWSNGGAASSIFLNPAYGGSFSVTATAGTCSSIDDLTVTVNANPTISITAENTVCNGSNITLTTSDLANGTNDYSWTSNASLNNVGGTEVVAQAVTSNADVMVIGTTIFGCKDTAFKLITVINCPTAIQESSIDETLKIYPNPTDDILTIYFLMDHHTEPITCKIYSTDAKLIYNYSSKTVDGVYQNGIDVSRLPVGIYYLKIQAGNKEVSKNIVVK